MKEREEYPNGDYLGIEAPRSSHSDLFSYLGISTDENDNATLYTPGRKSGKSSFYESTFVEPNISMWRTR